MSTNHPRGHRKRGVHRSRSRIRSTKRSRERCSDSSPPATPPDHVSTIDVRSLERSLQGLEFGDTPSRKPKWKKGFVKGKVLFRSDDEARCSTRELPNWTHGELRSLTSFLMLFTDGKVFVSHKNMRFWSEAGKFIQREENTGYCRSGMIFTLLA